MLNKKRLLFVLPLVATLSLHANDPFFNDPFGDNIFKEMMDMQKDMDKMFQRMHQRMQQRTAGHIAPLGSYKIQDNGNFIDKGAQYEYVTNIPESKENQIDIHSNNGIVSITAKIIQKKEVQTAHGFSSSSSMRMYQQKLALPKDADENTLNMGYKDGHLVLTVDKKKNENNITKEHNTTKKKEVKKIENENNTTKEDNTTNKKEVKKVENEKENKKIDKIKLTDDTSMS